MSNSEESEDLKAPKTTKPKALRPDPEHNWYSVSQLSHGKTDEIMGKVQRGREVVSIIRYGKFAAKIVPYDAKVILPEDDQLLDPTARFTTPSSPVV